MNFKRVTTRVETDLAQVVSDIVKVEADIADVYSR